VTLTECITEVLELLDIDRDVVITRGAGHAYQVRFSTDVSIKRGYRLEGRRWMDGTERTPTTGTERAYVGWARWSGFMGFGVDGVLADDWRIL
jgi:hypothetical protein